MAKLILEPISSSISAQDNPQMQELDATLDERSAQLRQG